MSMIPSQSESVWVRPLDFCLFRSNVKFRAMWNSDGTYYLGNKYIYIFVVNLLVKMVKYKQKFFNTWCVHLRQLPQPACDMALTHSRISDLTEWCSFRPSKRFVSDQRSMLHVRDSAWLSIGFKSGLLPGHPWGWTRFFLCHCLVDFVLCTGQVSDAFINRNPTNLRIILF